MLTTLLVAQLPLSSDEAGIHNLPDGSSPYGVFLQSNTTTAMTPQEVHALGLRQVARIESQMDQVLRELGYSQGSVEERFEALEASLQPPSEPDPRPQLIPLPGPKFQILEMRTLTYHEGVPGHHFQIALQQESKDDLPEFRRKRVFGRLLAFTEG